MSRWDADGGLRLWLIRHGETAHNLAGRFQGQLDTPLTDNGLDQARQTGRALIATKFVAIFSSDLRRAADTAVEIASPAGLDVAFDSRLRELHYGVLQDVPYTEFRAVLACHGLDDEWGPGVFSVKGIAAPGGESLDDLLVRLNSFVNDLIDTRELDGDVAVVAHGGSIRTLLTSLLDLPAIARDRFAMSNCGVTQVTYRDGQWRLEFHNRVYWR